METIDVPELRDLINQGGKPLLSIYMPTHRSGPETRQDPIRLRNLVKQAEALLNGSDGGKATRQSLKKVQDLLDNANFWQHQSDGLALFVGPDLFRTFRLPIDLPELVVCNDRPHIKPLLPLLHADRSFHLLTLSQNEVHLYSGSRYRLEEVKLPEGVPTSMAEALAAEVPEKQLQFHTESSPKAGDRAAMFHSQGTGTDDAVKKKKVAEFLRMVARGVDKKLGGNGNLPLVLAGTDYVCSLYREVSHYGHILEENVHGNPDSWNLDERHAKAWAAVEPALQLEHDRVIEQYLSVAQTPRGTDKISKAVASAYQGRIDLLLVAVDQERWGRYDAEKDHVESHPEKRSEDEDLLDFAAVHALRHGGRVFAVPADQVPGGSPVAAVLRQ